MPRRAIPVPEKIEPSQLVARIHDVLMETPFELHGTSLLHRRMLLDVIIQRLGVSNMLINNVLKTSIPRVNIEHFLGLGRRGLRDVRVHVSGGKKYAICVSREGAAYHVIHHPAD